MRLPLIRLALVTLVLLLLPALVSGQPVDAEPAAEPRIQYFQFFVQQGGWIAWLLILLSVVTIAITLERFLSIRRGTIVPAASIGRVKELIGKRHYVDAISFAVEDPSQFGYVLGTGLREAKNGYLAMERALEEALEERAAKLFRRIEYLNIIGNVSPMIGLFGTVTGMIFLFARIHATDTMPEPSKVAEDIAVALITTFWGLAVAIWALSFHAILRNRIDVLMAECALSAEQILATFKPGAVPAQPQAAHEPLRAMSTAGAAAGQAAPRQAAASDPGERSAATGPVSPAPEGG